MSRNVEAKDMKSSPLARRLVRRLRDAGLYLPEKDEHYALCGHAPGHWQKSSGAWAWSLYHKHQGEWRPLPLGSADPASSLRKHSKVSWYVQARGRDTEVCIENRRRTKNS